MYESYVSRCIEYEILSRFISGFYKYLQVSDLSAEALWLLWGVCTMTSFSAAQDPDSYFQQSVFTERDEQRPAPSTLDHVST